MKKYIKEANNNYQVDEKGNIYLQDGTIAKGKHFQYKVNGKHNCMTRRQLMLKYFPDVADTLYPNKNILTEEESKKANLRTVILHRYRGIITRCYDKDYRQYDNYGGRGIKVCKQWLDDRESFVEYCLNNGFKKELTIDRIKNEHDVQGIDISSNMYSMFATVWNMEGLEEINEQNAKLIRDLPKILKSLSDAATFINKCPHLEEGQKPKGLNKWNKLIKQYKGYLVS